MTSINGGLPRQFSGSDQTALNLPGNRDHGQFNLPTTRSRKRVGARVPPWKRVKGLVFLIALVGSFLVFNWWMLYRITHFRLGPENGSSSNSSVVIKEDESETIKLTKPQMTSFGRLLRLASHALSETKAEPEGLWEEPYALASTWKPCAEERSWEPDEGSNGYIMITANGGLNQQRVAVCNAVVVARLLNATLVVPKFFVSSVWRDVSQFGDIYQEDPFINYLKPDIRIVKELPQQLQSLDLEAIGSLVTDEDIMKEAKPSFYREYILPILLKNRVVHFLGFGNRLAYDPIPFQLQRLRCRCNFHALRFVPKIQKAGALILERMRVNTSYSRPLDYYLLGPYANKMLTAHSVQGPMYLALHLRFEIDMVAHSLCEFGGGEEEHRELEAYRKIHFPALTLLKKSKKLPSPGELRLEGLCPLTPEEAVLMLAALGFSRKTHIYLAGAHIYGGASRLSSLRSLYPHLVTKENLLSPFELEPFKNFSSQLAALDFIGCTASTAFAMTDSGSQLSALVTGFRIYYGGGRMATIRPNKRRLAKIFTENSTIEWSMFEHRMRKAVRQNKKIHSRPTARSIYRHPRCKECMCFMG